MTTEDMEKAAFPCGLVAKSFFNDTFKLFETTDKEGKQKGTKIDIDSTNIAWKSDVEYKFKNLDRPDWDDVQWTDVENRKYIRFSFS